MKEDETFETPRFLLRDKTSPGSWDIALSEIFIFQTVFYTNSIDGEISPKRINDDDLKSFDRPAINLSVRSQKIFCTPP